MRRHRLLVLTPDYPPAVGGIQNLLGELCERLTATWDVTVIAPAHDGAAAHDAATPVTVVRTRVGWGGPRSALVLTEMTLRARRLRADLTVAGHLVTLPAAALAARGAARPPVAFLYGSELWTAAGRRIGRRFGGSVGRCVAISDFTAVEARRVGFPAGRIVTVQPGAVRPEVAANRHEILARHGLLDPGGEKVPYLVTVARLAEPHKGHDAFIRCVGPLAARVPRFRWVVVGDGPLRPQLERTALAHGVADRVVFAGEVSEPVKGTLVQSARALLMLSRESAAARQFEGYGLAFVEAALLGVPSVAGRSGGVPDAVVDGVTGLLVAPQSVEQTVAACLRVLEDTRWSREVGESARRHAEGHQTWDAAAPAFEAVLEEAAR